MRVSTKGLCVAGVPIGTEAWVTKFVAEKVEAVILDVGNIDHELTDGMIHFHMMCFCQNTRPAKFSCPQHTHAPYFRFTWQLRCRLESVCTKGTVGTHTDWTHEM